MWKQLDQNLKVRLLGEGLFNLCYWMYFPFIALYFSATLGTSLAGGLLMLPPFISLLGNLVSGGLADFYGRRPILLLGAALQTVMFAIFACSFSPWVDYIAFIGVGLGGALYRAPSLAMVADLVTEQDRRSVFALFATTNNIGSVMGPALGAIFFFHYRQPLLFITACVMLIYTISIFIFIKESKPLQPHSTSWSLLKNAFAILNSYKHIFSDSIFLRFILGGVFSIMTLMQLDLYLAYYVVHHVPAQPIHPFQSWPSYLLSSEQIFGYMLGLNGLMFVAFISPLTKLTTLWKERDIFIVSCLLSGVALFAIGMTTSFSLLLLMTAVFTLGEILRAPASESFVSAYAPAHARATYISASNLQYTVGRTLAPISILLSGKLGTSTIFYLLLGFSLIGALLYVSMFRGYESKERI
ncbi:MFS transporter [Shouchella patagoniensis]|uniref:MFS transporter n=1 Tax=Shouchella patagoniensis TaxID=228576 RepID=UPI001FEC5B97|nr:MFS transporter [Shouchella patagoniensis]